MKRSENFALAKAAASMLFFTVGSISTAAAGNVGLAYILFFVGIGFTFHFLKELPPIPKKKRSKYS